MEKRWGRIVGAIAVIGSVAAWILTVMVIMPQYEIVTDFTTGMSVGSG